MKLTREDLINEKKAGQAGMEWGGTIGDSWHAKYLAVLDLALLGLEAEGLREKKRAQHCVVCGKGGESGSLYSIEDGPWHHKACKAALKEVKP